MYRSRVGAALALVVLASVLPLSTPAQAPEQEPTAPAQEVPPPTAAEAEERRALEEQIRREMGRSTEPRSPEARAAAQGAQPQAGGNPLARLLLTPDISAIASASGAWDSETKRPRFFFEELELALQAVVDPFARADLYVAFSDEGAEIEEAFLTTLGLPAGLQLRAGKFYAPFGRLNQMHPHVWEFVDAPLAQGLLSEESLGGAGVALSWLAPVSWFAELHAALQSVAPGEEDEARLTGVARLSQYLALTPTATLGLGLSAARRSEARSEFRDLGGADLYLRLRPLESRSYLTLSGELYALRFVGVEDVSEDFETGWWVQAFGRAGRFLGAGVRYERAPFEEGGGDVQRLTGLLGYFPSEFQRVRLQLSYDRLPGGADGVSALLNVEFGIGAHGAHPF
jgi:hypothetical protein